MLKLRLKYFAFRCIILMCKVLPQRFLYFIALRGGDLNYFFDKRGREAVLANLRVVLPDASEERLRYEARWVFRNFGKYLAEFFRFTRFDDAFFNRHVAFRNRHIAEQYATGDRGVIFLSAHLSNWELLGAGIRRVFDRPFNIVIQRHLYEKADRLFMREREAVGIHAIPVENAPLEIMRILKEGGLVGMLGDRDTTGQGVEVEFFGRPCRFPQGPARFAVSTGAVIIPTYVLRRTNDSFTACFEEPITVPETGDKQEKVAAMTQEFANRIEEAIRWHPEEWSVFYRFWEEEWIQGS